ncbi:MAG: glycosyltransferase, partial [Candidatus Limnocylindrales bacterium]
MIERVAFLSMHTCPVMQPGIGDAGGMNVYVDRLARAIAARGIDVDVFTRRTDPAWPENQMVAESYRVVHLTAGPTEPVPTAMLGDFVPGFALGVLDWARANGARYDAIHSHYWLSGWAGLMIKKRLDVGLVHSFHTLGRIKDANRAAGQPTESLLRIATEHEVIECADRIVVSTPFEAGDLVEHYGARPESIFISPPGVDHRVFQPAPRAEARERLGIGRGPLLLSVGRIQALKGVDVAIEALAIVRKHRPDARLVVIGGPSGTRGEDEVAHLHRVVADRDLGDWVEFRQPETHAVLADYYRAADVLLMPSRTESFGLVAAEAQASGLPVVAAAVGGLAFAITDGTSGLLIEGYDPARWAAAIARIIDDPAFAAALSAGAVANAEQF